METIQIQFASYLYLQFYFYWKGLRIFPKDKGLGKLSSRNEIIPRAPDCSGNPLRMQRLERKAGDVRPKKKGTKVPLFSPNHVTDVYLIPGLMYFNSSK